MTKDMTQGNPLEIILTFAIPLLIGNLLQQGYTLVDNAIVGQYLGTEALAGVGASSSVQFLVLGFCIGTSSGFAVPIAQRFGAGDYEALRKYQFNSYILTGIIAVLLTAVCALSCPLIIHALSTPDNIYDNAYIYLLVIFLGIPFNLAYNLLSGIMRALGDSRTPFIILAFCSVMNVFLDLFCIIVLGLGCAGAALATITSQGISAFFCYLCIQRKYEVLRSAPEDRTPDLKYMKTLVVMGVPMGLQYSITAIGSMVMQTANNSLGSIYVTGYTAGNRLKLFAICPFDALATAVSTFAGQNLGAGKIDRIKKGILQGVTLGVAYGICIGLVMALGGKQLALLFIRSSHKEEINAAAGFLFVSGCFIWMLGILNVIRLCTQGLGYSGRAIFSGVVEMIARTAMSLWVVPIYKYRAICFCDQAAWISAVLYMIPTIIFCIKKIEREQQLKETEESYGQNRSE